MDLEVSLLLTDNEEIHRLNRSIEERIMLPMCCPFRFGFKPIDRASWLSTLEANQSPESEEVVIGDIVISVDKAEEQAEEYGHDIKRAGFSVCTWSASSFRL